MKNVFVVIYCILVSIIVKVIVLINLKQNLYSIFKIDLLILSLMFFLIFKLLKDKKSRN